eukprot:2657094-Prorocentrum_lima.AAC.1
MDAVLEPDLLAILLHHLCQKQTHTSPRLSMGGSCVELGCRRGKGCDGGQTKQEGTGGDQQVCAA